MELKQIIKEAATRNDILEAIENKNIVTIYYAGDTVENEGYREIKPYVFGDSLDDNPVVRAYQIRGATDTESPGWKLFRIDRIRQWNALPQTFDTPDEDYNPYGDEKMNYIYAQAKF